MVGSTVLERFEVERKLGRGGFGTVYQAWDRRLERDVAVKVIDAEGEAGRRVLTEAQASARLNHPGIVTLYELGEADGQALLVSELIEGDTLHRLTADGVLSDREIAHVGADLCEALDHAHNRGVIHRDVKPQNVLVTDRDPQAKLMDFGIARVLDSAGLTATGGVVGTLAYMAPEQAAGGRAGAEADVYSLALTLYECWSGHNPHVRPSPVATARVIGTRLPSLGRRRRDLPADLVGTIDACLDPDPRRRPDLEELGTVIEASLDALDPESAPPARGAFAWPALELSAATAGRLGNAAVISGLLLATLTAVGGVGPFWGYLLVPAAAALALLSPRLGFVSAAAGLAAWLVSAGHPGAALALALVSIPPALLVRNGSAVTLPAAAPVLGACGLGPLYPALAGFVPGIRSRLLLTATGYVWLVLAEIVTRRDLLFGATTHPSKAWADSTANALTEVLIPMILSPGFLGGLALWMLAATLAGMLLTPVRAWRRRRADLQLRRPLEEPSVREEPVELADRRTAPGRALAAGGGRRAMVS